MFVVAAVAHACVASGITIIVAAIIVFVAFVAVDIHTNCSSCENMRVAPSYLAMHLQHVARRVIVCVVFIYYKELYMFVCIQILHCCWQNNELDIIAPVIASNLTT